MSKVDKSINQVNEQIKETVERDDKSLRNMLTELISTMKAEIVQSVSKQVEVLECKVFDTAKEVDSLIPLFWPLFDPSGKPPIYFFGGFEPNNESRYPFSFWVEV